VKYLHSNANNLGWNPGDDSRRHFASPIARIPPNTDTTTAGLGRSIGGRGAATLWRVHTVDGLLLADVLAGPALLQHSLPATARAAGAVEHEAAAGAVEADQQGQFE
jgi:hypothetical protein